MGFSFNSGFVMRKEIVASDPYFTCKLKNIFKFIKHG